MAWFDPGDDSAEALFVREQIAQRATPAPPAGTATGSTPVTSSDGHVTWQPAATGGYDSGSWA